MVACVDAAGLVKDAAGRMKKSPAPRSARASKRMPGAWSWVIQATTRRNSGLCRSRRQNSRRGGAHRLHLNLKVKTNCSLRRFSANPHEPTFARSQSQARNCGPPPGRVGSSGRSCPIPEDSAKLGCVSIAILILRCLMDGSFSTKAAPHPKRQPRMARAANSRTSG